MRRLFGATALAAALSLFPSVVQAQVGFGATAAYHLDAEALGVGAVVTAPLEQLHENVGLMGDFTWYFPDGFDYFEINGNLTYDFATDDGSVTPFALGGLVIARTSVDFESEFGDFDGSATDVGLNLGGGIRMGQILAGGKIELGGGESFVIFGSFLFGGD